MFKKGSYLSRHGFTVLELVFVLIGIGVVILFARPYAKQYLQKTRHTIADTDINGKIYLALERFNADRGSYPEKLEDLVFRPADDRPWGGPYLRKGVPSDPWQNPYLYNNHGTRKKYPYDLISTGPDGKAGTADDILNTLKPPKTSKAKTSAAFKT